MKNTILTAFILLFTVVSIHSQRFISDPIKGFSYKQTAYITLNDGKEIEGQLKKVKRKKGLFEAITIKLDNGEKKEILAKDIKLAYLPQNGWDKMSKAADRMYDINTYTEEDNNKYIDMEKLKEGYALFEVSNTQIRKKKEGVVLLQLLNPANAQYIKIYHDPFATETASMGVQGFKVAGGEVQRSYFIKVGDKKAIRLKKKNYDDFFSKHFSKCKAIKKKFDKIRWKDLGEHIQVFTETCR